MDPGNEGRRERRRDPRQTVAGALSAGKSGTTRGIVLSIGSLGHWDERLFPHHTYLVGRVWRTSSQDSGARRSHLVESSGDRTIPEDTKALMKEYFLQLVEERRERIEKEAREERKRVEEGTRVEKEKKRLERLCEKQQYEEDRDARLLSLIDARMMREQEDRRSQGETVVRPTKKVNEFGETIEEKKERLRRTLTLQESFDADEEFLLLRKKAVGLRIQDKRKHGKEVAVRNNPPMTTPKKRTLTTLTDESRRGIEELQNVQPEDQPIFRNASENRPDLEAYLDFLWAWWERKIREGGAAISTML
ncbi:hypothetical protein CBR_g23656 [Chara braunii]|uniref:Uncharacterized protein n=1 Tax=Chara braunii TaxID=69332 RepID=A0A388L4U8_CHABU|nr:hypothetical protein CBR_g23656 [Chara braunii]|eukprot:GBG77326.1 hypothetical protein CBR_g23656 [Chara braunii]